ncbi:hypothetical protein ACLOJK_012266 [Asimina triloba]
MKTKTSPAIPRNPLQKADNDEQKSIPRKCYRRSEISKLLVKEQEEDAAAPPLTQPRKFLRIGTTSIFKVLKERSLKATASLFQQKNSGNEARIPRFPSTSVSTLLPVR